MTNKTEKIKWNTRDLDFFPDDGKRYEIIDGELIVTRAPHWKHQRVVMKISYQLENWCQKTGLGEVTTAPGIIFTGADNVIPDVVWISLERLQNLLDEKGHLIDAPELIVEVLSKNKQDLERDLEIKLKLYSNQGVQEYWVCDYEKKQVKVFSREQAALKLSATLFEQDNLSTNLLPGFSCQVSQLFD